MALTVGEVAELTGVTVRTLHHYDQIGLVPASGRNASGHRVYDRAAVERLQTVLFHRALDFPLDQIAELVNVPDFDRAAALRHQRDLLAKRLSRTQKLLAAVDDALAHHTEGAAMADQDTPLKAMLEVFGEEQRELQAEAKERWGDTDPYAESHRRTQEYGKEQWEQIKAESSASLEALAAAKRSGAPAESDTAMDAAEDARLHIDRWFYPCSHEMHAGLGDMYVLDPRFKQTYEDLESGLAEYVRDAIVANGLRAL